jgi:hypothetical protein
VGLNIGRLGKKEKKAKKKEKKRAEKADDAKAGADIGKVVNLMAGDASKVGFMS